MTEKACPHVSIIIPTYNRRALVPEAIETVLSQDWPHIELIVVDDGSVDGTADFLQQSYGGRLRLIRQANAGTSAACNAGFRASTGDFLAVLDSDDELPTGSIRSRAEALIAAPWADISYGSIVFQQSHGQWPEPVIPPRTDERAWPKGDLLAHYVRACATFSHTALMFRRKLLPPDGVLYDPQTKVLEDFLMMVKLLSSGQAVPCYSTVLRVSRKAGPNRQRSDYRVLLEQGLAPLDRALADPRVAQRLQPVLPQVRALFWMAASRAARHLRLARDYRHAIRQAHAADPQSVRWSHWRHFFLSYFFPRW